MVKSEKQQLREKCLYIERLISWQNIAIEKAKKRYHRKKYWAFSFWLTNDVEDYARFLEREEGINDILNEHLELISNQLINCN